MRNRRSTERRNEDTGTRSALRASRRLPRAGFGRARLWRIRSHARLTPFSLGVLAGASAAGLRIVGIDPRPLFDIAGMLDAISLLSLLLLLTAATRFWARLRDTERDLESLKQRVSFDSTDVAWLLRDALRIAESIPRLETEPVRGRVGSGRQEDGPTGAA